MDTRQYLVFVRHEESEASITLRLASAEALYFSKVSADIEVPLTPEGFQAASLLGSAVNERLPKAVRLEQAFCSELLRTEQTLQQLLTSLGYELSYAIDARLNKRNYGIFWNVTYKGVQTLYPQEWERYQQEGAIDYRPPEGENYHDLLRRANEFIAEKILASKKNSLVVTHSSVILSILRDFANLTLEQVHELYERAALPSGNIIIYSRELDSTQWQLESFPAVLDVLNKEKISD